ncbi:MAG: hypothetical protein JNL52_04370 [Flavobacteriales bacterium]|nr:hypothetical protein [Flavobacteriales bacterium]
MLTLFLLLVVVLALVGWAWNRGFRPADRGPLVSWSLLVSSFGLVLLLRHFDQGLAASFIISGGLVIGGLLGRAIEPRGLIIPVLLIAALLGLGLVMSALVLSAILVLVLLFSTRSR